MLKASRPGVVGCRSVPILAAILFWNVDHLFVYMNGRREMPDINELAERHIREHQARLKHIDELMAEVDQTKQATESMEIRAELESIKQERSLLARQLDEMREKSAEQWAEKGGPMVIWDVVANRLERLVERIKH
jgi:hypothetical protein